MEQKAQYCHLLILGAGGGIGKKCVELALAAGYQVTAVLRNPAKLQMVHEHLLIIKGDITEPASFSEFLENADAVVSAIGVSGGLWGDKLTALYSDAAANILSGLKKSKGKRAFFISASALDISPLIPFYVQWFARILQIILKHMYADLRLMERIVKESNMDWTIIRPPQLTDTPRTGNYRIAISSFLKNCRKISRADVADFIVENIANSKTFKATVEISY